MFSYFFMFVYGNKDDPDIGILINPNNVIRHIAAFKYLEEDLIYMIYQLVGKLFE